MTNQQLKVGDIVKVVKYRAFTYAPGVKDDIGTEDLFKSMVGKRYRICGFDQYGHIELRPKPLNTVWIERDLVELTIQKGETRRRRVGPSDNRKRSAQRVVKP